MHWPGSFNVQVSSTPKSFNTFELQAWDIFKSSGSLRRSHIPLFSEVNPTIPSDKRIHNVYQNLGFTSFFHRDINGFSMASLPSPEFRLLGFPTWESDSVYDDGTSLWRFVKLGGYMYTGEKKTPAYSTSVTSLICQIQKYSRYLNPWKNGVWMWVLPDMLTLEIDEWMLLKNIPLKNIKVSWDYDIPNIWKIIKFMF